MTKVVINNNNSNGNNNKLLNNRRPAERERGGGGRIRGLRGIIRFKKRERSEKRDSRKALRGEIERFIKREN